MVCGKIRITMSSFTQIITNSIDTHVKEFISQIAETFTISEDDLLLIWNNSNSIQPSSKSSTKNQKTTTNCNSELMKLSRMELAELCKLKKLRVGGTKAELIHRLEESNKSSSSVENVTQSSTITASKNVSKVKPTEVSPILQKLGANSPVLKIARNKFNNYEHKETSLVFDSKTNKVVGKQLPDGSISALSENDIEQCQKYNFPIQIPENLNETKNKKNEKVLPKDEEFDEDDFEEELVEEVDELVEETGEDGLEDGLEDEDDVIEEEEVEYEEEYE